ncbi:hypothetical protein F0562_033497 [Nyssa sinensis]|uniref:Uncharacterized protein n=1 Tax=Nyssa sinensis TaxID=561372 RepID=A0A5J5ADD1_9ASTE|nr:hypothetical protein F0562_033497 [Nyssa sinensis]
MMEEVEMVRLVQHENLVNNQVVESAVWVAELWDLKWEELKWEKRSQTKLLIVFFQGKSFSLLFPIEVKNIQKAEHGSDSGVYDTEGRFVPSKFEEIFGKHARTNSEVLTSDEFMGMLKANRVPKDYKLRMACKLYRVENLICPLQRQTWLAAQRDH